MLHASYKTKKGRIRPAFSYLGLARNEQCVTSLLLALTRTANLWSTTQLASRTFQHLSPHRVLQFGDSLSLNLSDSLSCYLKDSPHLFQGVRVAISQTISETDDFTFAIGESLEHAIDFIA